ncbi:hypothetical protein ACOME3_002396 [Neoechinorhynchus agilis]
MENLPSESLKDNVTVKPIASAIDVLLWNCKSFFDAAIESSKRFKYVQQLGVDGLYVNDSMVPEQVYSQLILMGRRCFSEMSVPSLRLKRRKVRWHKDLQSSDGNAHPTSSETPLKSILKNKDAVKEEMFNEKEMEAFMTNNDEDNLDELYDAEDAGADELRFEDFFKDATHYEREEMKTAERVAAIEQEMVEVEKPWQMRGEVEAKDRPSDSAIEEYLEFDRQTKVPVAITAELTTKIESIVRRRIKDRAFDDVERKVKPLTEYRPPIKLDFEKSQKGLADVYGDAYSKSMGTKEEDPEETKREEVRESMRELFKKLDTLSHSMFTPTPALPEVKILSSLPTVVMEEIGQVLPGEGGLDDKVLAPEEVAGRIKSIASKDDLSKEEKKTMRRKAKKKRKARLERKELEGGKSGKRSLDEKMVLKRAERLLHKTPNMRIAEKEMAKPRKRKLLA